MAKPEIRVGEVTPPREVLDYFRAKRLQPAFSWLDVFGQEHAHAFTVAKAVDADVLAAFRATIDDAIARGLGYDEWVQQLEPKLRSLGWWGPRRVADPETGATKRVDFSSPRRLENIFWSNMRAARAAGQWDRAQQSKDILPFFLYVETTAADPRQEHLEWVGTILPIDDPWWNEHFPPNGWGCQCSVRQIGRAEAKRLGGVSSPPPTRTRAFRNRRTGEEVRVPVGIDPGWHTNPGKSRSAGLGRVLADKIGRIAGAELRRIAIEAILWSEDFLRLWAGRSPRRASLPVADLPAKPAGSSASVALLSTETALKQIARHPEIKASHYRELPDFIVRSTLQIVEGRDTHFIGEIDGQLWDAVIKRTRDGDELYLSTFHRIAPRDIERLQRRAAKGERKEK